MCKDEVKHEEKWVIHTLQKGKMTFLFMFLAVQNLVKLEMGKTKKEKNNPESTWVWLTKLNPKGLIVPHMMGVNMPDKSHPSPQFNCCPKKITLSKDCDQ